MSDVKQARELIRAASRDISALRGMRDPEVFADEIYGLHTQQAAEKLLKAWFALLGEVYPLTHNLELLLSILQERGVATEELKPLVPCQHGFDIIIHPHPSPLPQRERG